MSSLQRGERRVTFYAQSLGVKLNRGPDGRVRVMEVRHNNNDHHHHHNDDSLRQGDIDVGDVLREVVGIIDMRHKQVSNKVWGEVIRTIKVAPRPLVFVLFSGDEDVLSNKAASSDVGVEVDAFDPFHLAHSGGGNSGNENVDSNRNHHRKLFSSKKSGGTGASSRGQHTKGSHSKDSSSNDRRTRSLTPPRSIVPSIFGLGRHTSRGADSSSNNNHSSMNRSAGKSKGTNSAQALIQGAACIVPKELRELGGGGGGQLQEYGSHQPYGNHNNNWETQIECADIQQMLLVSQISLDEDLLEFQQEENQGRYVDGSDIPATTDPRKYYQEEHKEDEPGSRQGSAGARRQRNPRRLSF